MAAQKEKRSRASGWIFSVVIAIVIWLLVTYASDTDITKSVRITGIQYTGEETLAQNGLVIKKKDVTTDTKVKLRGKRNDFIRFINEVSVEIDVSNITEVGEYALEGRVKAGNLETVDSSYITVTIETEKYVEKEVPIVVEQVGVCKDFLVKSEPKTSTVKVSGGESEVNDITRAYAEIDISKITKDCDTFSMIQFVDSDDKEITEFGAVPMPDGGVAIRNTVYERAELTVMPELSSALAAKYSIDYDKTEVNPQKVTIGLHGRTTDTVRVVITEDTADERTYRLLEEDGMYIPETDAEVKVKASLTPKEIQTPQPQ